MKVRKFRARLRAQKPRAEKKTRAQILRARPGLKIPNIRKPGLQNGWTSKPSVVMTNFD